MPFSQYLYPSITWYFIQLESLGLQLVDYWYRLLVVFSPNDYSFSTAEPQSELPQTSKLQTALHHQGPGLSLSRALKQGLSRLMLKCLEMGISWYTRKKNGKIWEKNEKHIDLLQTQYMKRGTCFRSTIDAINPLMMLRHL